MAVVRWDPWGDVAALQRDVQELVGRAMQGGGRGGGLVPAIDAHRTESGIVVRVELPGVRPEDVDIAVQDGMLSIAGERHLDKDVAEDAWLRRERTVGRFERTFSLPEGTDPEQITAAFDLGVLELHVPHPPARKPRRISIATGAREEEEQPAVDVQAQS